MKLLLRKDIPKLGLAGDVVEVSEGYARTLSIAPNTSHQADLAARVSAARAAGAGLWATCPPDG